MKTPVTNIADLRAIARRRVPRAFFEYADRGSYDEATLRENRRSLDRLQLRQRVMLDVDDRSLATTLLGQAVSMPLAIAPTGLTGLQHGSGEILGARAAAEARIPFCLSTMSICSIEQVRAACDTPFWFQVYVMRDRGFTRELIRRARAAQCSALMLTADLTVQGQRHREIKNGLSVPPKVTLRNLLDIASKPRWAWNVLKAPSRSFGNLEGRIGGADSLTTLAQWIASQFDPTLNWNDLAWIREEWPGKLIVKGILDPEDARLAVQHGVDAIVVSNHGGRQLDGAPGTIDVLPAIVDAVQGKTEVLFDSGITSGQDLLKALALGARAGLIGKAFLYGLGANGQQGVTQAIELIRRQLSVTMALTGQRDASRISRDVIWRSA
ncbi:alpha-hydroxy acid oxidase [Dyella jiangningensis]|uniref:alpha-hydroxy acid oxidase n=1 Tax=Dyella jiangningensis TaxID=1379159 RepID=UPI002410B4E3|nr:alpha-hydroxy acid oxidase [Dyella jiangningensis]MDG2538794.1 alpha-hydroxy acid oxidase [Dyella jiangningensis]